MEYSTRTDEPARPELVESPARLKKKNEEVVEVTEQDTAEQPVSQPD